MIVDIEVCASTEVESKVEKETKKWSFPSYVALTGIIGKLF